MNVIKKALVFDEKVLVSVIVSTDLCEKARKLHNLSHTATAALGRTLTACAFMASELKGENEKMSVTINGDGPLGKIIAAGNALGEIRGYVENPFVELPLKENGKLDVGGAVGTGRMSVCKDLALKEPYFAEIPLVSGEIAEDFSMYFYQSEQRPSAVALGVNLDKGKVTSAGGIIMRLMPDCPDEIITIVEDIATHFTHISALLAEKSPDEILDFYFGHFDPEYLPEQTFDYKCNCSKSKIASLIKGIGKQDAFSLLDENEGKISVHCDFCNKDYIFEKEDLNKIFNQ